MVEIIREEAVKHLGHSLLHDAEYVAMKKEVVDLLKSRRLRKRTKTYYSQKRARLCEELSSMWKHRRFDYAHRVTRQLAGTGSGPRQRCHVNGGKGVPTLQGWETFFSQRKKEA